MITLVALLVMTTSNHTLAQPRIDLGRHVSHADITYITPATRTEAGLPIGNGTMGTLMWTTPNAMHMQINRVDVFANDCTTRADARSQPSMCRVSPCPR